MAAQLRTGTAESSFGSQSHLMKSLCGGLGCA
jgi:hypothetical protein